MTAIDGGLQPERTALAWQRSALSVIVGAVGLAKVLAWESRVAAVVVLVVGLAWSIDLALVGRVRAAQALRMVRGPGRAYRGGALLRTGIIALAASVLGPVVVVGLACRA